MITGKTDCGMLYAVRNSGSAVGYCSLSIRCGTRDEEGFHDGIAHFTEHTLFKGTARKSASVINSYLDRLGGELNAYTTKEEIVLHATVLKEDIRKAAGLLMELVTSPRFPARQVETERGVVIDEINSCKDNPWEEVYDKFEEKLFAGHPLSHPILGTADSVRAISSEELLRFVEEKFRPECMAFSLVAPVDEAKAEKEIKKMAAHFFPGRIGSSVSPTPPPLFVRTAPPFDDSADQGNHEVNAVIGGVGPSLYEEKDRMATILLSNILGGPASNSILNETLRERGGWVYNVECTYTQYSDTGIVAISLGCEKENVRKCCAAVRKEILRLQMFPLSEARLRAAKKQLLGQLAISSDNGEAQCLSMGKSLLSYGNVLPESVTRARIEAITSGDIQAAACKVLGSDRLCRLIYF